jgi:hypothetical protein
MKPGSQLGFGGVACHAQLEVLFEGRVSKSNRE